MPVLKTLIFHCHRNNDGAGMLEHRKLTYYKNKPHDWLLAPLGMKRDAYTLDATNLKANSNAESRVQTELLSNTHKLGNKQ